MIYIDPRVKYTKKFWEYLEQLGNYHEDSPLKWDQKHLEMLIIFRVINIFQKDWNFTFFVIYSYKINILPSAWDH